MSVDLSLIIPNKCRSIRDKEDARKCFYDTIDRIVEYFHGNKQFVTDITIIEQDEYSEDIEDDDFFDETEYSFEVPFLNITAFLHAGYWDIWPVANYNQYFYPCGTDLLGKPYTWPRHVCFNTLLAFGETEGWICDEFHSWNSNLEDPESTFEDWKTYGETAEDSTIYEFDIMDFADVDPEKQIWPDYKTKYHDAYNEWHAVLKAVRERFPEYEILSIECPLQNHALAVKGGRFFILNYITGQCLTDNSIDYCRTNFNGAGIQVFRGEKSAFFNREGKQLTEFRVGDFSWGWDTRCPFRFGQTVTDKATGAIFLTDGTPYIE